MTDAFTRLTEGTEQLWSNDAAASAADALTRVKYGMADIEEAEARLIRFAPLIAALFGETREAGGVIESPLTEIPAMKEALGARGRLFIKRDSELAIAGSVKARGGIYEVLKHTEDIMLSTGNAELLSFEGCDMEDHIQRIRSVLSRYKIQVGSTGNLGLSIGIMSAALGFKAIVHMSSDAKEWKKELLRKKGVEVIEYEGDYSAAVAKGRELSSADPMSYFVDDENSVDLFMGYAVAALRLKRQLAEQGIEVDASHKLNVYLPCGVGGAPGGICFGLKCVFGDNARCYFAEPTQAPCMLAAFITGEPKAVTELGLLGKTEADGLAVGKGSALVYEAVRELVDGEFTVEDKRLNHYQRLLFEREGLFIEPSSAIAFDASRYFACGGIDDGEGTLHIAWATGGRLVPAAERAKQLGFADVVAALIWREGRFLICRRPPHKARGGLWEFAGGKIEPDETAEQALIRECREELGVTVEPICVHTVLTHEYPDLTVRLTLFNAAVASGELTPLEHTELKFIAPREIKGYEFCPADEEILRLIEADANKARLAEKVSEIDVRLFSLGDEKYREFQIRLVPNIEASRIIGVRLPELRLIARELKNTETAADFMRCLPHYYQEENLLHALLLNEERDIGALIKKLDEFLPHVDNWAVCDTLRPKVFKKHRGELWTYIRGCVSKEAVYTVRFGLEMLMTHFLDEAFIPEVLNLAADTADRDAGRDYYIDMMAAWFFATALAKRYSETLPFTARLPQPVRGMAVRKACESCRLTEEQKAEIKDKAKC